jgi:hypothetical protein
VGYHKRLNDDKIQDNIFFFLQNLRLVAQQGNLGQEVADLCGKEGSAK